jgi:hypothetical protein
MARALEDCSAPALNSSSDSEPQTEEQAPRAGQLVDRHGNFHSEAIFKNWSLAAIRSLGIHRVAEAASPFVEITANATPAAFKRVASTERN